MKGLITGLVAAPVLALFVGVGVLAWRIGDTWDQRNTDSLVTALAATCAGGAIIVGLLLALIVGVPLALRAYENGGYARRAWPAETPAQWRQLPGSRPPAWAEQPPMLTDKQGGQWQSAGMGQYDLWEDGDDLSASMGLDGGPAERRIDAW
jgi:hypothetical protein